MPEAPLAREAELCYGGISVITNYAAGLQNQKLTATEVVEIMSRAVGRLRILLKGAFDLIPFQIAASAAPSGRGRDRAPDASCA